MSFAAAAGAAPAAAPPAAATATGAAAETLCGRLALLRQQIRDLLKGILLPTTRGGRVSTARFLGTGEGRQSIFNDDVLRLQHLTGAVRAP